MTTKPAKKKPEYEVKEIYDDVNYWSPGTRVRVKKRGGKEPLFYFSFSISDTPDCCGINLIHDFEPDDFAGHASEKIYIEIGKWLKRRLGGMPHTAFTNNEQQVEEKILTAAGFELVGEFRGNPGHRSRIKQWNYIPSSRRIKVKKKPSSEKQRVHSAPAKRATR